MRRVLDWLQSRTGYRDATHRLLHEGLPPGTGWFFTLGSVLLALLAVQFVTGAGLALYYAATPDHAYDSVTFIERSFAGRVVRGLHHYGSSAIVIVAVLHIARVVVFGSYRAPREVTWLSGLALFGLLLGFALTGYLLPWDQRAYWATVVTINIARLAPGVGEAVGAFLRGGPSVGALTLSRWYALHVIVLPAVLVTVVVLHLALMRRHGISGPVRQRSGGPAPFYPWQAARDTAVIGAVLFMLALTARHGAPPLEAPADPANGSYVPRPEWYFLGLFQLLKYFPGRWEVVGAVAVPGGIAALLALLPWLDRAPGRGLRRRAGVLVAFGGGVAAIAGLTALGWRDRPVNARADAAWSLREIGGRQLALGAGCDRCHAPEGMTDPWEDVPSTRGAEWMTGHVADPEIIGPGLRESPPGRTEREIAAIVAYVRKRTRSPYPGVDARTETAATVYARFCVGCHVIDGEGGGDGPELSRIGRRKDASDLKRQITDPEAVKPDAEMPSFASRLTPAELDAIASYLASRR